MKKEAHMIVLENFVEKYPGEEIIFNHLEISPSVEHSDIERGWGSALSLSIEETLKYSQSKAHSFIPSSGLLFSILKTCLSKEGLDDDERQFMQEIGDYWHRTASLLVFPTADKSGYVIHYPELAKNGLIREQNGELVGRIKIPITKEAFPPYGQVARVKEYPDFFKKILGSDCLEIKDLEFCMWIPPEKQILTAPEKLIILGAFAQYGMGLWLTSHTQDKALAGSRPFRLAYNIPKSAN